MALPISLKEAKMEVRDGELFVIKSGKHAKDYIKRWQKKQGVKNGTSVRLITEDHLNRLIEDANIARAWGA